MENKQEKKPLSLRFPLHLVERIDEYANRMGVTRNSAVILLCNEQLESIEQKYKSL